MLPLTLLKVATGSPLLVELKGGDTYNGRLVSCDAWMNMNLRDVICTSRDGDRFWKLPSCYIRGSAIKYLRLPTDLLQKAQEEEERAPPARAFGGDRGGGYQRGTSPGRGRGRRGGGSGRGPTRGGGGGRGPSGDSSGGRGPPNAGGGRGSVGGGRAPRGGGGRGRKSDSSEPRGRGNNPNYRSKG